MNSIVELFNKNLSTREYLAEDEESYQRAMVCVEECETILTDALIGAEKEQFIKLLNAQSELLSAITVGSFHNGFKIGAHLMLDTFVTHPQSILEEDLFI